MIIPQNHPTGNPTLETTGPEADLYTSFISGHEGVRHRSRLSPAGLRDDQIIGASALVLKPDGGQFAATYPRVGPGSRKGDVEPRRACLLRYLLRLFPRAQILGSGGSDASFHVVLPLDPNDQSTLGSDRARVLTLLDQLRAMAFCDQIGHGLKGALSARAVGSVNSKTGSPVVELHPATREYTLQDLEELAETWFQTPEVSLFRGWFGVSEDEEHVRCPFHDSADPDLKISDKLFCFGANHCAADSRAAIIHMVPRRKKDKALTLSGLFLADATYRERWAQAFLRLHRECQDRRDRQVASQRAAASGKRLLSIDRDTSDDLILAEARAALGSLDNLYCDAAGSFITLDPDLQNGHLRTVRHERVGPFISLLGRGLVVRIFSATSGWRHTPLPEARATAILYRPELRQGLRVLTGVTKNPVLDLANRRVQPSGYDPGTHLFYDGPALEIPEHGRTPRLDELLSGWTGLCGSDHRSCRSDSDLAHVYAAVFTEILADTGLFTLHRHPLIRGNQKGVGKDKLAEILGILRDGETPVDLNHSEENRINQGFGNGIHAGRHNFQVTNINCLGAYANPMLTRWLTSESLTGPKHGGGTWSINPNTATVVFTINRGSIDHDLLDRLLPINLEVTGDARKRTFGLDPVHYARKHRLEIVSEVLGLALICLREGRVWEIPTGVDRRFERWVQVIGSMLEKRELPGFMQFELEVEDEVNEDANAFAELARRMYRASGDGWLKVKEIVALCRSSDPATPPLYPDVLRNGSPERSFSKYVLMRWVNEVIALSGTQQDSGLNLTLRAGQDTNTKAARYRLEVLNPKNGGADTEETAEKGCGDRCGDTQEDCGDALLSPQSYQEAEPPITGIAGMQNLSPQSSPQAQPLSGEGVKVDCGDCGDKPIEDSPETPIDASLHPNTRLKDPRNTLLSPSLTGARRRIPAIPVSQADLNPGSSDGQPSDPWAGGTL